MKDMNQARKDIESKITDVTVYLMGAQITRVGSFPDIAEEAQSYVLTGLPEKLSPLSIQVSASDGVVIRSVEHAINHLKTADNSDEIKALQDELEELEDKLISENNLIDLGNLEESLFSANSRLVGSESGINVEDLKAAVYFHNERMAAIRETRIECNKRIELINRKKKAIQTQLGGFSVKKPVPVSEITIVAALDVNAGEQDSNQDSNEAKYSGSELTISYFVSNAKWSPFYDIRVGSIGGDVALHYKANVSQNTGEDWEDVKLTLSTGEPGVDGSYPELKPWYLVEAYRAPAPARADHMLFPPSAAAPPGAAPPSSAAKRYAGLPASADSNTLLPMASDSPVGFNTGELPDIVSATVTEALLQQQQPQRSNVAQSMSSVEYNIIAPYTVKGGEGGQDVEIKIAFLSAKYRYYCVPKLKKEVYLLAAIDDWASLNLVKGNAAVFFENRYVGKTYIDPSMGEDSLDLSLGVDKAVMVSRVKGRDFTTNTLTGGNVKRTRQWELAVRNLKDVPIDIELIDQVPVSTNKLVTVDAAEVSDAELDKGTGLLTWKFTLSPAESRAMYVRYVVTSPKNSRLMLD